MNTYLKPNSDKIFNEGFIIFHKVSLHGISDISYITIIYKHTLVTYHSKWMIIDISKLILLSY
jgi:hypothetical protein